MEKYIQNIELINQYTKGLLTGSEKILFEEKLKTDATFATTYNEHIALLEGIKRQALKTEILKAKQHYLFTKWFKITAIILAAVTISVVLFNLFSKSETPINNQQPQDNNNVVLIDSSVVEKQNQPETEIVNEVEEVAETVNIDIKKIQPENNNNSLENFEASVVETKIDSVSDAQPDSMSKELISLYQSEKKAPEIFQINNEKRITINCKEGTKLTIPAKAFIYETSGKLVRGKIELSVTEYYKLSDMLLANLSTTSDGNILETGGMLYVEANKKGAKLKFKQGKQIQIEFNNSGKQNMQIFSGEEQSNNINWKLQNTTEAYVVGTKDSIRIVEKDIEVPIEIVEEVPVLPNCEGGTQEEKRNCFKDYFKTLMDENFNTSIAKDLNLKGTHEIKAVFKINKEGNIVDVLTFSSHVKLGQEAVRVLELVPKMKPAKQRGRTVSVPYGVTFYFNVGKSTKRNPSLIRVEAKTSFKNDFFSPRDSILVENVNQSSIVKRQYGIIVNEISNYVLSTSQLGWINCDRFVRGKNTFKYKIKVKNGRGANVKMVFKSLSSILSSKAYNDVFDFGVIPKKEPVILVAIKEKDGQFYLAIEEIETVFIPSLELQFKEVTINELKSELGKLNQSFD